MRDPCGETCDVWTGVALIVLGTAGLVRIVGPKRASPGRLGRLLQNPFAWSRSKVSGINAAETSEQMALQGYIAAWAGSIGAIVVGLLMVSGAIPR